MARFGSQFSPRSSEQNSTTDRPESSVSGSSGPPGLDVPRRIQEQPRLIGQADLPRPLPRLSTVRGPLDRWAVSAVVRCRVERAVALVDERVVHAQASSRGPSLCHISRPSAALSTKSPLRVPTRASTPMEPSVTSVGAALGRKWLAIAHRSAPSSTA